MVGAVLPAIVKYDKFRRRDFDQLFNENIRRILTTNAHKQTRTESAVLFAIFPCVLCALSDSARGSKKYFRSGPTLPVSAFLWRLFIY